MYMEQLTQGLSIQDVVNITNNNNTNTNSTGIDMSKFKRILYIIQNLGLGAAGTIDGRLQSAANANFNANVHNITNSNLTQITANNVLATIEVRADQVQQQNPGDRYVRLQLTGGGNALNFVAIGLGGEAEQKPASQYDLNTTFVAQRVVVNT